MSMIKNLKIRNKLILAFTTTILSFLVLSFCILYIFDEMATKRQDIIESVKLSDGLNEAKYFLTWDKQLVMEVLASGTKEDVNEQMQNHLSAKNGFDENISMITELSTRTDWGSDFSGYKKEIQKIATALDSTHNTYIVPMFEELYQKQLIFLSLAENDEKVKTAEKELSELDHNIDDIINQVNQELLKTENYITQIVDSSQKASEDLSGSALQIILIISVISLILSIIIGVTITNAIAKPLKSALGFANKIAGGDLTGTIDINQKDEVGDLTLALKTMSAKLKETIGATISASKNIAIASSEMNASAQTLSQSATEQASSIEEISSSMEEITTNIKQNTNNSKETEKIAQQAANDIREGNASVAETTHSMKIIADKISIIGEISRQTNLLALNAAVEAARAGEYGRGFAVVAAEVRKLAERSHEAAAEIDQMSFSSVNIAEKSGVLLNNVVPNILKTSTLVQEISAANNEQHSGATQINTAIQQLNQIVQSTAATAEEMAASAEELNAQAEHLKESISFFKTE